MGTDAGIKGWLTINASDYQALIWANYVAGKEHQECRRRMLEVVRGFYPSAELIDVDVMDLSHFKDTYTVRTYFMVPGTAAAPNQNQPRRSLTFPAINSWLPDFDLLRKRQTNYWQWTQTIELHAQLHCLTVGPLRNFPRRWKLAVTRHKSRHAGPYWAIKLRPISPTRQIRAVSHPTNSAFSAIPFFHSRHGWGSRYRSRRRASLPPHCPPRPRPQSSTRGIFL